MKIKKSDLMILVLIVSIIIVAVIFVIIIVMHNKRLQDLEMRYNDKIIDSNILQNSQINKDQSSKKEINIKWEINQSEDQSQVEKTINVEGVVSGVKKNSIEVINVSGEKIDIPMIAGTEVIISGNQETKE